jgi:hypothetical protein
MGQLVLLVVAAAWAAVLLPPLLRSRVENRPNSSVTDFRRQLNRLQSTVPSRAVGAMRPVGRPRASSPLQRPAAPGRPGVPHHARRSVPRHAGTATGRSNGHPRMHDATMRPRTHGDERVPQHRAHRQAAHRHVAHRQVTVQRAATGHEAMRRRRSNVLFVLVLLAGSTLFLAATTKATAMLYAFVVAFLALCGYVYLLTQLRQREQQAWPSDWPIR